MGNAATAKKGDSENAGGFNFGRRRQACCWPKWLLDIFELPFTLCFKAFTLTKLRYFLCSESFLVASTRGLQEEMGKPLSRKSIFFNLLASSTV